MNLAGAFPIAVLLLAARLPAQVPSANPTLAEAAAGEDARESDLLDAVAKADYPSSKKYVGAVLAAARYYVERGSLLKVRELLQNAEQRQLRSGAGVFDTAPIEANLADVEGRLHQWADQAATLGGLVQLWSASAEGPTSTVAVHFTLKQAQALRAQGNDADANAAVLRAAAAMCRVSGPWKGFDFKSYLGPKAAEALASGSGDASCWAEGQPKPSEAADEKSSVATQASPPASSAEVAHPMPGIKPPKLLEKIEPQYSSRARRARLEGIVKLIMVVRTDGHPGDIRLTDPLGLGLDEKAIEAVKQWKFAPGEEDGKPRAILANIEVSFHLL